MIKRPTWILLGTFTLFVVVFLLINGHTAATTKLATPTNSDKNFLISRADGILKSISINDDQNRKFRMERDSSNTWFVLLPTFGIADQALASSLETQVSALRIVTTLEKTLDLENAGLVSPTLIIELTYDTGTTHDIQVGSLTPSNSGYYVNFDNSNLYIINQPEIDSLFNLLTTPPYLPTETPGLTTPDTVLPATEEVSPTP